MEVLYVGVSKEWKSAQIVKRLNCISKQKSVSYVVSDDGRNLIKYCDSISCEHISDVTHVLINALKGLYQRDETFIEFNKLIGEVRKLWYLSTEKSVYLPPKMRIKLRFTNIFPCVDWAVNMLQKWEILSQEVKEKLFFLKQKEAFIQELFCVGEPFKISCEILKKKTLGKVKKPKYYKH